MELLSLGIFISYRCMLCCRTGLAVVVELRDAVHYATMKPPRAVGWARIRHWDFRVMQKVLLSLHYSLYNLDTLTQSQCHILNSPARLNLKLDSDPDRYQPDLRLKWRPHRCGRISEPKLLRLGEQDGGSDGAGPGWTRL